MKMISEVIYKLSIRVDHIYLTLEGEFEIWKSITLARTPDKDFLTYNPLKASKSTVSDNLEFFK